MKSFKRIAWITLVIWIFDASIIGLGMTKPSPKPEHKYLVSLMSPGEAEDNSFHRFRQLNDKFLFVGGHGYGKEESGIHGVLDQRADKTLLLTPEALAQLITDVKRSRKLPEDIPIYLLACNAGAGSDSFAKKLSQILITKVVAPSEWLVVDQLGFSRTGAIKWTAFFNFGEFKSRTFANGQEQFDEQAS